MINRFLLSIGLVFLVFSLSSLFILIPLLYTPVNASGKIPLFQPVCGDVCSGPIPHYTHGTGAVRISESSIADELVVEYEWPKQMYINDSDSISVALTVVRGPLPSESSPPPTPTPIGNVSDREINSVSPNSLATEEAMSCTRDPSACLISNIFGDGYKLSTASAYVVTTSFDAQLMGPVERSTDQPLIEWDWNIFPKSTGRQVINVGIDLQWTPTGKSGGMGILRQLWESPIAIEVDKPFFDAGQLSVSAAVSGVFGTVFTGFSLQWMLEQRRQKREEKKKKIKYCQYCRAENPEDFVFCTKCGKKRITLTDTIISAPLIPSPGLTGDQQSSVGSTAGVQETPASGSSQEGGK